jgi:predicted short-subunit dehydrogenase-like oxidoreductase (DUF2520 family)
LTKHKIAIIGAGKIAYSLSNALVRSGYEIQFVVSKKLSSAKSLANKFSIKKYSISLKDIPESVNVFLLTVPDGQIKKTAEALSKTKNSFANFICIHFSGVENISVLNSLMKKGCSSGSLHIIRPFPSKEIVDIRNSPASIEKGDNIAKTFLLQLSKKLKLKPHLISSEEKVFYHLAAVHSSNFLVGNLFNAFTLINHNSNLPKDILKRTTQSALENVFKLSPAKALSGPIDRGDIYTINKHIKELDRKIKEGKNFNLKLLRKNYIIQSLSLLNVVKAKYGKLNINHKRIEKFLKKELN